MNANWLSNMDRLKTENSKSGYGSVTETPTKKWRSDESRGVCGVERIMRDYLAGGVPVSIMKVAGNGEHVQCSSVIAREGSGWKGSRIVWRREKLGLVKDALVCALCT